MGIEVMNMNRAIAAVLVVVIVSVGLGLISAPPASAAVFAYYVGGGLPTSTWDGGPKQFTNVGVHAIIDVVSQQVTGCLAYWIGDDSAANIWGQVGWYTCNGNKTFAFYQIWNLSAGKGIGGGQTPVVAGAHVFSMQVRNETTVWAFAVDGVAFGSFDMKANVSKKGYPVQAVSEETLVSAPWTPARVTISTIETLQASFTYPAGNGWYKPRWAYEPWRGCDSQGNVNRTAGYSCWGIAGKRQDSTIPRNTLVIGGAIPRVRAGVYLWLEPS